MSKPVDFSKLSENSAVWAVPLIKDGVVYVGACDKYFYALDLESGHKKWEYKTGGVITSGAVMHEDVLYFGSFDTYLYALSKDGNILWRLKTGGIIAGKPAVQKGIISEQSLGPESRSAINTAGKSARGAVLYFGSTDNYFYAISLETHEVLWKFRTGDEIIGDPLVDNDRIYFGSQDGYFYCLDFGGSILWKFRTGGAITIGAPAMSDDFIFFGSEDQNWYALAKDGTFKWGFRTGDMCWNYPFAFGDKVIVGSRDQHFYALDQKTGALKWKFRGKDTATFAPVLCGGFLILSHDSVYALDPDTGALVWAYRLPPYSFSGAIAADEGIVVCGLSTGFVAGINAKTGKGIWKFKTKSTAALHLGGVVKPPKFDTELFEKIEGAASAIKRDAKEPYTFTTLLDTFGAGGMDKKEYAVGDGPEQNQYKLANAPGAYGGDDPREKKKREELLKITRTLFGS